MTQRFGLTGLHKFKSTLSQDQIEERWETFAVSCSSPIIIDVNNVFCKILIDSDLLIYCAYKWEFMQNKKHFGM